MFYGLDVFIELKKKITQIDTNLKHLWLKLCKAYFKWKMIEFS
jgi:hypothetical protein